MGWFVLMFRWVDMVQLRIRIRTQGLSIYIRSVVCCSTYFGVHCNAFLFLYPILEA